MATVALTRAGHAVSPPGRVCAQAPTEDQAAPQKNAQYVGAWSLLKREEPVGSTLEEHPAGEGPIRIQAPSGLFAEIRVPAQPESFAGQASNAGFHTVVDVSGGRRLSVRHRVVDFRPPTGCVLSTQVKFDREAEVMGELSHPKGRCRNEYIEAWTRLAAGPVAALELVSEHPPPQGGSARGRTGYWLFCSDRFVRIIGPPVGEGLVAGTCCGSVEQLEALAGVRPVRDELRGAYEASWGRIEAPGRLRVARQAWLPVCAGPGHLLYEASSGTLAFTQTEVIHRLLNGVEQRWRVRDWGLDPFTPVSPSAPLSAPLAAAPVAEDDDDSSSSRSSSPSSGSSAPEPGAAAAAAAAVAPAVAAPLPVAMPPVAVAPAAAPGAAAAAAVMAAGASRSRSRKRRKRRSKSRSSSKSASASGSASASRSKSRKDDKKRRKDEKDKDKKRRGDKGKKAKSASRSRSRRRRHRHHRRRRRSTSRGGDRRGSTAHAHAHPAPAAVAGPPPGAHGVPPGGMAPGRPPLGYPAYYGHQVGPRGAMPQGYPLYGHGPGPDGGIPRRPPDGGRPPHGFPGVHPGHGMPPPGFGHPQGFPHRGPPPGFGPHPGGPRPGVPPGVGLPFGPPPTVFGGPPPGHGPPPPGVWARGPPMPRPGGPPHGAPPHGAPPHGAPPYGAGVPPQGACGPGRPPGMPPLGNLGPPPGMLGAPTDPVTAFVKEHGVDNLAEESLRKLPADLQREVIAEGPLIGSNSSAVLMSRVRNVEQAASGSRNSAGRSGAPAANDDLLADGAKLLVKSGAPVQPRVVVSKSAAAAAAAAATSTGAVPKAKVAALAAAIAAAASEVAPAQQPGVASPEPSSPPAGGPEAVAASVSTPTAQPVAASPAAPTSPAPAEGGETPGDAAGVGLAGPAATEPANGASSAPAAQGGGRGSGPEVVGSGWGDPVAVGSGWGDPVPKVSLGGGASAGSSSPAWPSAATSTVGESDAREHSMKVQSFFSKNYVDAPAEESFRGLSHDQQRKIMGSGPLSSGSPSSELLARIREATGQGAAAAASPPMRGEDEVARFVRENKLDREAEASLRALPRNVLDKVFEEGPLRGESRNPSTVVISRVRRAKEEDRGGGKGRSPRRRRSRSRSRSRDAFRGVQTPFGSPWLTPAPS